MNKKNLNDSNEVMAALTDSHLSNNSVVKNNCKDDMSLEKLIKMNNSDGKDILLKSSNMLPLNERKELTENVKMYFDLSVQKRIYLIL